MTIEAIKVIDNALTSKGINYEYDRWTSNIIYPYWVGEYSESVPMNEDGMQEATFILSGFTRGKPLELEQDKQKIKDLFDTISGYIATTNSGSVVAIFYANSVHVPIENDELKSIQITLSVKEWRNK